MAVDCQNMGSKKLNMYGFGIPGQGFYVFDLPEAKGKINQAIEIITVIQGEANEEKLDKELKNLVKENWDYKVRRIDQQEYIVVFPDRKSLDTFSKLSCFEMSLFGLKGKLTKSAIDPKASFVLHTVWIRVCEVRGFARDAEIVKEMTKLVAEPLVVDELSLVRAGPIRVQGRCRNPDAIKGKDRVLL